MSAHTILFYSILSVALAWNLASCAFDYRAQRFRLDEAERSRKRLIILRHVSLTFITAALLSRMLYLEVS